MAADPQTQFDLLFAEAAADHRAGRLASAESAVRQVLARYPDAPDPNALLGAVCIAQGRWQEAEAALEKCLAVAPDHLIALNNLARLRRRQNRAAEAAKLFRRATRVDSANVEVRRNLLDALCAVGNWSEATRLADAMARKHGDDPATLLLAARSFLGVPHPARAIELATRAHEAGGDGPALAAVANAYAVLGDARAASDVLRRAFDEGGDPEIGSRWLMALQYDDRTTPGELARATRDVAARWTDGIAPHVHPRRGGRGEKLNVGILSADFRQCSTRYLGWPVLSNLDARHAWHFFASVREPDDVTREFQALGYPWHDIEWLDDDAAARCILDQGIDILIDLNGHTRGGRPGVLARRPAPVQVSWLDYPGSTGLPTVDWILADDEHVRAGDAGYDERVYPLPDNLFRYVPPEPAPDPHLPCRETGAICFGVTNQAIKATPLALDMWAGILGSVPDATLYLTFPDFRSAETQERFRAAFSERGIEGNRIRFGEGAPTPQAFLSEYRKIDIALDTVPYTGGLTTLDALYMGVPVVTLEGDRFCARHASAHLRTVGRERYVAKCPEEYASIAVKLAQDRDVLVSERHTLRDLVAVSPLMDGKALAEALSDALAEIWDDYLAAG